ncbi:hypothetical protein [Pseudonocardia sp.]|jgi:hypothetical protein|uniref:hypothetical protein n=1 Tax=Pseudonocardia sp. TaxID=60912 RepID=UPI003D112D80
MTTASILNLLAWVLSAVIAAWLVYDVVRVARTHDEEDLINAAEMFDDLDPQAAVPTPSSPSAKEDGR